MAEHALAEPARTPVPARGSLVVTPVDDEPGRRGSLVVKDRVVERMASFAALTVPGVVRHAAGLDRVTGRELPRVGVSVAGDHVRATVDVAVLWPQPLTAVTSAVRAEVTDRLAALSGLTVDAVDVAVTAVVPSRSAPKPRRVQ